MGFLDSLFGPRTVLEDALAVAEQLRRVQVVQRRDLRPFVGVTRRVEGGEIFVEEVRVEIAAIDRAFGHAHFELTGWSVNATAPTSVVSTQERVLSGVAGLLVGDFSIVTGGAGGWRSVAGAFGANIVTGFVLLSLGLAGSIIFWPVVIVAGLVTSLVTGSMGLEDRVKNKVLETVLPGLANAPLEAGALLESQLGAVFGQVEQETMTSILAVIEEEERNIHKMSDLNKRSQAEKSQALAMLEDLGRKVAAIRQALKEITVKAQQAA